MATSVSQGLSDDAAGGISNRVARRVTLADSASIRARLGPAGEGRILDISESGMAAQANMPIQPGSKITVDFDIPDGGHVRTEAQVVWRTADKRMGLRFLRMSEPTRLRLRAWIELLAGPEAAPAPASTTTAKAEPAPRNQNEFWHLISEIKTSKLYLDSALALIVERAAELTGATGAALAIGPSENMICRATLGDAPDVGTVINPDSKLTRECISTRHTVHVMDTDADPRVDPFVCRDLNMRSAVLAPAFPSKSDKNFTVVLEMFSSKARNFSPEQISKLEQLAEVAGVLALGDSAEADAVKVEALSSAEKSVGKADDSILFAQDELDHLVDRFITDLKIGGPAAAGSASEAKAPVAEKKADLKKPPAFEMSFVGKKAEPTSGFSQPVKASAPKPVESKAAATTEVASAPKKSEERKKPSSDSDLELVTLAEPVGVPFTPRRPSPERTEFTLGQHAEPSGSNVPMIAGIALLAIAIVGGGFYFVHRSNANPKPAVQAEVAPPPAAAPVPDPNTSLTVTAPAPPLPGKAESSKSNSTTEPAKKASESKASEKESKTSRESSRDAEKEEAAPSPIVLATAKRSNHSEAALPIAAPAISMAGGSAPPPTDIPVSTSTPELAASARSTGVTPGVLIHRVSPRYPSSARSYAVSGDVVLKGTITKEGNVAALKTVSGNPLLASAAIDAVKQWKYKPYQVDGKPIDMETTFRIQFALPK